MKKKAPVIIALLAAVTLLAITPSQASQLGPYVGGFYGQAEKELPIGPFNNLSRALEQDFFGLAATSVDQSLDTKDTAYGGALGVRINAWLAIEGMFTSLGAVSYRSEGVGTVEGEPVTATTRIETESSAIGLYALALWPINYRWEVYARFGGQFTTSRFDVLASATNSGAEVTGRTSESTGDLVGGAGIVMSIAEIYGVRLEYQRIFDAGHQNTGEADTDVLSLGFIVAF